MRIMDSSIASKNNRSSSLTGHMLLSFDKKKNRSDLFNLCTLAATQRGKGQEALDDTATATCRLTDTRPSA